MYKDTNHPLTSETEHLQMPLQAPFMLTSQRPLAPSMSDLPSAL